MSLLSEIQQKLKAPKNQTNSFGGYKYRSCEDILEAVKPLLGDGSLTLNDEIIVIGDRYYVKATAQLYDGKGVGIAYTCAYAREPLEKKGSDASQITGAASSYARKYALNGLFLIDDTKDADATNDHDNEPKPQQKQVWSDQKRMINEIHELKTVGAAIEWDEKNRHAIENLPAEESIQVSAEYERWLKGLQQGDQMPVIRIKMNAKEAEEWLVRAEFEMGKCDTDEELDKWGKENEGRVMDLSSARKAVLTDMFRLRKKAIKQARTVGAG